jgi:hypothetical protein
MERRRAHRFVRRVVRAGAVLRPEGLRREVLLPEAAPMVRVQPGPLALRPERAEAARPSALHPERAEAARPAVPAGSHRGLETPARHPARPSAAAAPRVRGLRLAEWPVPALPLAAMLAQQSAAPAVRRQVEVPQVLAAQPRAVPVARAAEGLLAGAPAVAAAQPWVERVAAAAQPSEAQAETAEGLPWAAQAAGAEEQPWAAAAEAEEQPWAAQAAAAEGLPSVAQAAAVLLLGAQAGWGAEEAPRRGALDEALAAPLSAAAWAAPLCLQGAQLAPAPRAQSAHAKGRLRIAQP